MLPIKIEEISELLSAKMNLRKTMQDLGAVRRRLTYPPTRHDIKSTPQYEAIGAKIGIPGKEFEILLDVALEDPTDDQLDTLRKMITLAKLRNPNSLDSYRDQVSRHKAAYEAELVRREKDEVRLQELEEKTKELTASQPIKDFRVEFESLLADAKAHYDERGNLIEKFDPEYAMFFKVLLGSSKHVQTITDDEGRKIASFNWDEMNDFHVEHISGIFRTLTKEMQANAKIGE